MEQTGRFPINYSLILFSSRAIQFLSLAQGSPASGTAWRECPEGGFVTMASLSDSRPDDSALISSALRGDEEALNDLFSRYYRFLHFLACRVLGGREDAQDVVQNCLLRVVRNLQQFNNDGAFRSWLARILVNEAIDLLRKRRRRPQFSVRRVSTAASLVHRDADCDSVLGIPAAVI